MNWNNIDLNSDYERGQNLLDPYSFDQLILEAYSNLPEINKETVRAQAMESIRSKYKSAIEVLEANLKNITDYITKERAMP